MDKVNIPVIDFIIMVKTYLKDIDCVFDIGSMDGKDSLLFKEAFFNANIYSCEGLPENYNKYLKHQKEIIPINYVIFNYDGQINFHEKNTNGIHSVFDRGKQYGTKSRILECRRIESICRELNIDKIDIAKIDVEGATYEVLESFGRLLDSVKMLHIETENKEFFKGQRLDDDISELLIRNNFSLLKKAGCKISDGIQFDSIWIKK